MKKTMLFIGAALLQQQAAAANIQSMAACMAEGQYRIEDIQRQTQRGGFRTVDTATGKAMVSATDGYRMMVHGEGQAPVGNLRFETSHESGFDADRKAIRSQMDHMAATAKGIGPQTVQEQELEGIETWALENPELSPKQGAGMYTLLAPASKVIATLYLFNQAEVSSKTEYRSYRDKVLAQVRTCLRNL